MKKLLILCFSFLLSGCAVSTNIEVTEKAVLEVAMDDSNTKPDQVIDTSVKKNDDGFVVTIEAADGTFVYYIDNNGWITDRKFEASESESPDESTSDSADESQNNSQERAILAALENAGLSKDSVTQIDAVLNNNRWTVTFRVENKLNTVEVEDGSFQVLSAITE